MNQESSNSLVPGSVFGSYRIARILGEGAFGAVYEAFRMPLNKRVALKVLHREMAANPGVVQRFLREAELVAQIEHPHIVDVLDVGVVAGVPFLAMEFLEGGDLAARLKSGPLDVPTTLDFLLPIFSAVSTVHARGIIHRDLKPDNILLSRSVVGGVVPKLLDFGIAKVQQAEHSLTRTNSLMGTPYYMSPEQARESKNINAQSDQWALAVIVFECVTGRRVFAGSSLLEILSAIATGPITPSRSLNPAIPQDFDDALLRALSRPAAERYPSVREFGVALLPFASPQTRERWAPIFAVESDASFSPLQLNTTRQPADSSVVPSAPTVSNGPSSQAPTTLDAPSSLAPAQPWVNTNTLEPTAHPLPELALRTHGAGRGRTATYAGGALLLVALIAGAAFKMRSESPTPTHASHAVTTPLRTVEIALRVEPSTASIKLDDDPAVEGALNRQIPRDGRAHTIRVSAQGYEPQTLSFRDEPPSEQITLHPIAPPSEPVAAPVVAPVVAPVAVAPPATPIAGHRRRRDATTPNAPPTPEPAPSGRIRAE